jgi:S1-C subfamily serine protease
VKPGTGFLAGALLGSAVSALILVSLGIFYVEERMPGVQPPAPTTIILNGTVSQEELVPLVVEQASATVVHITSTKVEEDVLMRPVPVEGTGSGVIIDPEGYILTNDHVVVNSDEIEVTLPGRERVQAKLMGADPSTDTAVIKIDYPEPLPAAVLGDSSTIRPGQMAIAIGNPYGLDNTVTVGVISAVNRSLLSSNNYIIKGVIQTDAAVNPGNSGGPLLNSRGEVIGINSAIISTTEGFQGIGFAIPINTAREVARELIERGKVVRPWLGITGLSLTPDIAKRYNLTLDSGVLVVDVVEGGPAELAGLRGTRRTLEGLVLGDIILEMDGVRLTTIDELIEVILRHGVGDRVEVKYLREGREETVVVRLGERPAQ